MQLDTTDKSNAGNGHSRAPDVQFSPTYKQLRTPKLLSGSGSHPDYARNLPYAPCMIVLSI